MNRFNEEHLERIDTTTSFFTETTKKKPEQFLREGFQASTWIQASPHEWVWTQEDQEAMAASVQYLWELRKYLIEFIIDVADDDAVLHDQQLYAREILRGLETPLPEATKAPNLNQYLKERRKAQKLSLNDVATRARISKAYLADIEAGRKGNVSIDVFCRLASALHVSPQEMISEISPPLS